MIKNIIIVLICLNKFLKYVPCKAKKVAGKTTLTVQTVRCYLTWRLVRRRMIILILTDKWIVKPNKTNVAIDVCKSIWGRDQRSLSIIYYCELMRSCLAHTGMFRISKFIEYIWLEAPSSKVNSNRNSRGKEGDHIETLPSTTWCE